jgi:hypothetical protein
MNEETGEVERNMKNLLRCFHKYSKAVKPKPGSVIPNGSLLNRFISKQKKSRKTIETEVVLNE